MELIKEYSEKYGLKEVVNNYGEHRQTREGSIVFPNGWVASIVENDGVDVWQPDGKYIKEDTFYMLEDGEFVEVE